MKYYAYYPGCANEGTGIGQALSVNAIAKSLDIELIELEGWNCCGSSPYTAINRPEAIMVAARDLALAEKTGLDLVTPCSSCFITLRGASEYRK